MWPFEGRGRLLKMAQQSLFAEATRRAAEAKFKQKDVDSEGKELEVRIYIHT